MLFALGQPVGLVGLVLGFALAVVIRAVVQRLVLRRTAGDREPLFNARRDFDIFGIVAALLGGVGWGKRAPVGFGNRTPAAVLVAGPVAVLLASQLAFAAYRLSGGGSLPLYGLGDVVQSGAPGEPLLHHQLLLTMGMELLAFGLLALIPLPPLDGWGLLLRRFGDRPSPGFAKAHHWLDEQNIGIGILLAGLIIPLGPGVTLFLYLLNILRIPLLIPWW